MQLADLLGNAKVFEKLSKIDGELALRHRAAGCQFCGAQLHSAPYQRKPRGALVPIPDCCATRLSLCCSICRKRSLPRSCLFLGRCVYFGFVIVLLSGMKQGFNKISIGDLCLHLQVSKRTLRRWLLFFQEIFPRRDLWQRLRGRLTPQADCACVPLGILNDFGEEKLFEACCLLIGGVFPAEVQTE